MRQHFFIAMLFLAFMSPWPLMAQSPDDAPTNTTPNESQQADSRQQDVRLTKAPVLITEVQAQYTQEAIDARIEGAVQLRLHLDALGNVTKVEVLDGPGYGLNTSAAQAAELFKFEPAEINGQPAAVVLGFAVRFTLPILPADFYGTVIDPESEEGIEGVRVTIQYNGQEYDPAPTATTSTDEDGTFWFGDVPPGAYDVLVQLDEYRDFETDIDLPPGELVEVTYKVIAEPENLIGRVREAGTREQLAGVEVTIVDINTDQIVRSDFTNAQGGFAFRGLPPGKYLIQINSEGYLASAFEADVRANEITQGTYFIEAEFYDEYTIRTVAERERSEVNRQTIRLEEVRRVPGTGGDVVRVVQNLPGVARAPYVSGFIIVRGSAPQDTKIFLGGDSIPIVYHFFGGPAIVNTEMIDAIDFYPGNFSAYYGRATAGIIDLGTRSPRNDRVHGQVEVDLLDSSVIVEGPVSENVSVALSARRSYFDLFLPLVIPEDGPDVFVAPRYYDYQGWITYRGLDDHLFEFFIYGSDDAVDILLPPNEPEGNATIQVTGIDLSNSFHRGQARWEWRPDALPMENTLMASFGVNSAAFQASEDLFFDLDFYQSQIRNDFKLKVTEDLSLRMGADILLGNSIYSYRIPRFEVSGDSGPDGTSSGRPNFSDDGLIGSRSAPELLPAVYVEAQYNLFERLELIPGLRVDYYDPVKETSVSPRFSTRFRINQQWTAKGGVGLFTQPPLPGQTEEDFGNPNITYEKAMHYAAGVEWRPTEYLELDSTLFYRDMYDLVSQTDDFTRDDRTGELVPVIYNNDGKGRATGLEVLLRHYPRNRLFGWLGYTLSRSERLNLDRNEFELYRYDQTHILTLVTGYNLPHNWDISGRFRLVTGNPYTPIVGSSFDADTNRYVRKFGAPNSARNDTFHQLDLRVDKRFIFDTWMLGVYLDISNVYWAKNAEGQRYNYDYSDSEPVMGLPFLPTIGVNAKF